MDHRADCVHLAPLERLVSALYRARATKRAGCRLITGAEGQTVFASGLVYDMFLKKVAGATAGSQRNSGSSAATSMVWASSRTYCVGGLASSFEVIHIVFDSLGSLIFVFRNSTVMYRAASSITKR